MTGGTEPGNGADGAARCWADADRGTQLHHRLVVIAGRGTVEQRIRQWREGFRRRSRVAEFGAIGHEAREDAHDVAVDDGRRRTESDACDRRRSVGPHTRQFAPLGGCLGRHAKRRQYFRQPVEIARPGVITETFPELEHAILRGGGQRGEVGQCLQPACKVGEHRLHLCLLEHELAHDGLVERRRLAPRQRPAVRAIPRQQRTLKIGAGGRQTLEFDLGHGKHENAQNHRK